MTIKKIIFTAILGFFLFLGFYINFDLDKEFLSQSNYNKNVLVVTIIFFIGLKALIELYFFSIKKINFTKIITGVFALALVVAGVYAGYLVRTYSAEEQYMTTEAANQDIDRKNKSLDESKKRLQSQIESYDSQIKTIQDKINDTHFTYTGLIRSYRKEINQINIEKNKLSARLDKIASLYVPFSKKKTTLLHKHKSAVNLYFFIAIILELGLIWLAHWLAPIFDINSFIHSMKVGTVGTISQKEYSNIGNNGNGRKKIAESAENPIVTIDNLKSFREGLKLTQDQLAELSGVPRGTISKIETDRMILSQDILNKLAGIENKIKAS